MHPTQRASAPEIASWLLAAAALLLVMTGGSLAALYSGLLVYALVHLIAPRLMHLARGEIAGGDRE